MRALLKELNTLLLVPRFEYRDRHDQLRARVTMLFSSFNALLALLGLVMAVALPMPLASRQEAALYASIIALIAVLCFVLAYIGRIRWAAWLIFIGLMGVALRGIQAGLGSSILLTLVPPLLFAGIAWRWRGVVFAIVLELLILVTALSAQMSSEVPVLNRAAPALLQAIFAADVLLLMQIGVLAGTFAFEVQRSISYGTRLLSQLRGVLDISQITANVTSLDELLPQAVNYVRDRFGVYHVQIFLVDKERRYVNLVASTGETGKVLLERGYRLPVTSAGTIGQAIRTAELVVTNQVDHPDGDNLSTHRFPRHVNELLSATNSELVLPLVVGDLVIGTLDLQSTHLDTFNEREMDSMQLLASQVALAIYNAQQLEAQRHILNDTRRMFLEAETTLRESQQMNQRLTGQAWKDYMRQRLSATIGYTLVDGQLHNDSRWTPSLSQAAEVRRAVLNGGAADAQIIAVPIELRGQVIGAIEVEFGAASANINAAAESLDMIQAVAQRLAVSVDNARLFEQTQELAQQEFELNSISSKIQGHTDIQELVKVALHELGVALDADAAAIRLGKLPQAEARA